MAKKVWARKAPRIGSAKPPQSEKESIIRACEQFITNVLKPQFLPEIKPTEFNYPIDMHGKWHNGAYRFIQRFKTDRSDSIVPEFDAPFARLEYVSPNCFNLSYHRYTGEWVCIFRAISLEEALQSIATEPFFLQC
jgi:hypothetical protein